MGAFWSMSRTPDTTSTYMEVSSAKTFKRQMISSVYCKENLRLIPTLPDEISIHIFARVPRICYFNMRLVARNWKAVMVSPELFNLRKELGTTEEWLYLLTKFEDDKLLWHALDPRSKKWQKLPPILNGFYQDDYKKGLYGLLMRSIAGQSSNFTNIIRGWVGRKHASGLVPLTGCATGTANGCLYVLGGFSKACAMRCVWRYDPIMNVWSEATPMSVGRAYCKTSILNNKLYVVGGVSHRSHGGLAPLQSAEVFDPCTGNWSELPSMPFSKVQVAPAAFLADMLKPIATGMTSYKGRLCVPQSLSSWPFFVDVGGDVYDPETNCWGEMPIGMGEGWPVRQAGTKLSVVVDGELYALDPSTSLCSGKIKVYDEKEDAWKVVIGKVPMCDFSESEYPYLLTGFHGKLHVIMKDENRKAVVMQADLCNNIAYSSASSSSTSLACARSSVEHSNSMAESETVVWKVIAATNFGSAELVSCQVVDI